MSYYISQVTTMCHISYIQCLVSELYGRYNYQNQIYKSYKQIFKCSYYKLYIKTIPPRGYQAQAISKFFSNYNNFPSLLKNIKLKKKQSLHVLAEFNKCNPFTYRKNNPYRQLTSAKLISFFCSGMIFQKLDECGVLRTPSV